MAKQPAKSAQANRRAQKSLYRPENEAVWVSFRQLRKAAQLSQEEFGQRLRRNQSYESAAETGVIRLDALQIREWCQAAGTDMRTWLAVLDAQLAAVAAVHRTRTLGLTIHDGQQPSR